MNAYDIDWQKFFQMLPVWNGLSIENREFLIGLRPGKPHPAKAFGDELAELVELSLVTLDAEGRTVRQASGCRWFLQTLRTMARYNILGAPSEYILTRYLCDVFTVRERSAFCGEYLTSYETPATLIACVESARWVEEFLKAADGPAWEMSRQLLGNERSRSRAFCFTNEPVFQATQEVVREFVKAAAPVAFADLPRRFPHLSAEMLAKVVLAGIRHLLLFPAMRRDEMIPLLTLWPPVVALLNRPAPVKPKPVTATESFHSPFRMEDMTTLVVAAAVGPLRVRTSDRDLFAKAQKEVTDRLLSIPDWLAKGTRNGPDERIARARQLLDKLRFIEVVGKRGRNLGLKTRKPGLQWLEQSPQDRLRRVIHCQKKIGLLERLSYYGSFGLAEADLQVALAKTFGELSGTSFVDVAEFLMWHSRRNNPMMALFGQASSSARTRYGYYGIRTPEDAEKYWGSHLLTFIAHVLFPLGGACMGRHGDNDDLCMALTDVGRYLLGLIDDFDCEIAQPDGGDVVIQPNFDVTFLAPAPLAEAGIARFAERQGHGLGALFKVTKQSIFQAAGAGMTANQTLDTLRTVCSRGVPANVEREIRGWFDQCRTVKLKSALLVHAPDSETAMLALSAAGRGAKRINDTVIEVPNNSTTRQKLIQKLNRMGIFVR